MEKDVQLTDYLAQHGSPFQIVLTKADKLGASALEDLGQTTVLALRERRYSEAVLCSAVIAVSARSHQGVDQLQSSIAALITT
jgi:GTP-binding protein EngB required for normal cell division